jgi:hypothetical protein
VGERVQRDLHGKLRDELLNRGIFYPLDEAKVLIENRRRECSTSRPPTVSATGHLHLRYWSLSAGVR